MILITARLLSLLLVGELKIRRRGLKGGFIYCFSCHDENFAWGQNVLRHVGLSRSNRHFVPQIFVFIKDVHCITFLLDTSEPLKWKETFNEWEKIILVASN